MLTLTPKTITWLNNTVTKLHGADRRMFMAETVQLLGNGGASQAQRLLGWDRNTIRKGQKELTSGAVEDNFSARGRKTSEHYLPNLLADIQTIAHTQNQTNLANSSSTKLTSKSVRQQLLTMGYSDETLPTQRSIHNKLNELGLNAKSKAQP